jgi:hypothetical protein
MGRAVQLASGKWVSAGSKDDTGSRSGGSSSGGNTYISKAAETKGQEFYTGTRIPTSIQITSTSSSAEIAQQYNLDVEQQSQVSAAIIKARQEQNYANRQAQIDAQKQTQQKQSGFAFKIGGAGGGLPGGGVTAIMGMPGALGQAQTPSQMAQNITSPQMSVLYVPPKPAIQTTKGYENTGMDTGTYNVLTKKEAKYEFTVRGKEAALKDYSELNWYEKMDVKIGGVLPGGVSKQYAGVVWKDMYSMTTPKEQRQLANIQKLGIISATIGSAGLALPIGGAAVKFFPTYINALKTKPFITLGGTAATTAFGAVGVPYAMKGIERVTRTQSVNAIPENVLSEGLSYSRGKIQSFEWSDPELTKRLGQYIRPSGGREKQLEFGAREYLISEGYKGGQLEEGVATIKRKYYADVWGYAGGIVAVGAGSELMGRIGLRKATRNIAIQAATKITRAGFAEGFAMNVLGTTTGMSKMTYINNPITWGLGGALSAGLIGGKIAALSVSGRKAAGKGLLGAAYISDPGEIYGDIAADIGSKIYSVGQTKVRITVPTMNWAFGGGGKVRNAKFTEITPRTRQPPTISINKPYKISYGIIETPKRIVPISREVSISNIIGTKTRVKVPTSRGRSFVNINSNVPSVFNVPVSPIIPIPITPITNVPVKPIINVPININVPTKTNVPTTVYTPTNVPTIVDVPVTVPTFKFPFIIPGGGGSGKGFNWGKRSRVKGKYTPSLVATAFNIRGSMPSVISGLGIRPILGKASKSSKGSVMNARGISF